jgi:predicted nucleic acid-binding protein
VIYLDTGCLLKLYYPEPESSRVAALVSGNPIAFIALHELELYNALELKVYRKEATPAQVRATRALVDADVRAGVLHRPPLAWGDVLRDAEAAATAHTRTLGCRSLDVLHCAAARHLSAVKSFITTDKRQYRLAIKLGLSCPMV